jgi:plastocyanin
MVSTRTLGVTAALVCAAVLVSCRLQPMADRSPAQTHTVTMEGMAFQPNVIAVAAGDTIAWVNKDMVPHSATSDTAGFDSKAVQAHGSWRTRVERVGDFEYVCSFHPRMTARVRVR